MAFRTRPLLFVLLFAFLAAMSGCAPSTDVKVSGSGYGHGRGMGQWGALGYAVERGWSYTQILDHYYGGTTMGTKALGDQLVFLTDSKNLDLRVVQTAGALRASGLSTDAKAVRAVRISSGKIRLYTGTGCTGPWTLVRDVATSSLEIVSRLTQGDDPSRMLQRCTPAGTTYYRGALRLVDSNQAAYTVNRVDTEVMLRSIVARETSPGWADIGGGKGAQALNAQAVAARSYAAGGDSRWGSFATTCDSQSCQVYEGYGRLASGSMRVIEDRRSTAAVSATVGKIRLLSNGTIARTEFSAASGGYTAGGTFRAVADEGDAYSGNPYRNWSVTLTKTKIEQAFDARQGQDLGTFLSFDKVTRNGLGPNGGRVVSLRARFSGGDVTLTGDQFRVLFSLKSNLFIIK